MPLPPRFETALMTAVDSVMAAVPRPKPARDILLSALASRVVAHRGSPVPSQGIRENTVAAFDRALEQGVWGLELDVRFTRDNVPVISHDPSAERVFSRTLTIGETNQNELTKRIPDIPTLEAIIARYRGRAHLMIELKKLEGSHDPAQLKALKEALAPLTPVEDYHLISLDAGVLATCNFVPREALIAVGELDLNSQSALALKHGYGGVAGSYALLSPRVIKAHHSAGQKVGAGFIGSRAVLRRELNRGVDWLFTNSAPLLMSILRDELASSPGLGKNFERPP